MTDSIMTNLIHGTFSKKKEKVTKKAGSCTLIQRQNTSKCLLFLPISKDLIILKGQRSPTTEDIQKNLKSKLKGKNLKPAFSERYPTVTTVTTMKGQC